MSRITLSEEACIGRSEVGEPRPSPSGIGVGWVSATPGEPARLHVRYDDGSTAVLCPDPAMRTPRGMGGGTWCWVDDHTLIVSCVDGNLWRHHVRAGDTQRITDHVDGSVADAPHASPDGAWCAYTVDDAQVRAVRLDGTASVRLDQGDDDFVGDPCCMPCSSGVTWLAWSVPNMPWDSAVVCTATFDRGTYERFQPPASAQQPRLTPDGQRIMVRDDHGWLNVWLGDEPLVSEPYEHGGPRWGSGHRSFAISSDSRHVAFTRNEGGFGRLCVVDVDTHVVSDVARGVHGQVGWHGPRIVGLRSGAITPAQVVRYSPSVDGWTREVLAASEPPVDRALLVEPELVSTLANDGAELYARLYRADRPVRGLICWFHGGPTDQWQVTFIPRIAYWRSRGFHVLVPDVRGSTGYGRAYQQALRGKWGVIDTDDALCVLRHAHANGWGAPRTTALFGGSAGGFTALHVAAQQPELVAAVSVAYPVTDLADLAERSHRYEQHYNHTLLGPAGDVAVRQIVHDRSPINWPQRLRATPLLVLHGDADPVVPVDHSQRLVAAIRRAGGRAELHVYEGAGHGFRAADDQRDELRRVGTFLDQFIPD